MADSFLTQEPRLEDYKNLLNKPGDVNSHLEQTLPEKSDFSNTYDISDGDSSCRLEDIPEDEEENILHQNPFYYIADTIGGPPTPEKGWENGRKGHAVRNMGVWKEHGKLPSVQETYYNGLNIAEKLRNITFEQIENGYGIVGGSMHSFDKQTHFIASDLRTEDQAESDLPGLNNWFLYRIENGEAVRLEDYQTREKIGHYLEELLQNKQAL